MNRADELTERVLKLETENRNVEWEWEERNKRDRNMMVRIYNMEKLDSEDPERCKNSSEKIQEYLRFLGLNDVIENLEHCGGNLFKMQVENNDVRKKILNAQHTKVKQGISSRMSGMLMLPDQMPLEQEQDKLLKEEQRLRNKICRLRSDPWRWTIKSKKVVPVIDEIKNDPEAMQRLADELVKRMKMFRKLSLSDKAHRRARLEQKNNIVIRNIPDASTCLELETSQSGYPGNLEMIFNELGVSYSKVKKIKVMRYKDQSGAFPLVVTFKDSETMDQFLKRKKILNDAKEEWMKSLMIKPNQLYVDGYINVMLLYEKRLRNEISRKRGESCQWVLRSSKVVKLVGDAD